MDQTLEQTIQALRAFEPTSVRPSENYDWNPVPFWATHFDSTAGVWTLTEPAKMLLSLSDRVDLDALQADLFAWATTTYGTQTMERRGLVIAEEAGEVARVILKTAEGTRPSTRGDLGEELAQLIVAILVTAETAGIRLSSILPRVIAKLKARKVERDPSKAGRSEDPR